MCIIIHQPRGVTTPLELLRSAADYNPDGFGLMAIGRGGRAKVVRAAQPSFETIAALAREFAGFECAFHFRRRTRGSCAPENLHPFKLAQGLYLMHNGTANVELRDAGRSDTWHLVHDYLAPLFERRRALLYDQSFRRILRRWLGDGNHLVVMDEAQQRIEALDRAAGIEWEGLWLSNAVWIDRALLALDPLQGRVRRANQVAFL